MMPSDKEAKAKIGNETSVNFQNGIQKMAMATDHVGSRAATGASELIAAKST